MADKVWLDLDIKDIAECGNSLWILPNEGNILCRCDKIKSSIDYMTWIPSESMNANLYSALVVYRQFLILVPYAAAEILIFDTEKLSFEKFQLPKASSKYKYREYVKFIGGIQKGDFIYLMPGEFPEVVCIDMVKRTVKSVKEWHSLYGGKKTAEEEKEWYILGMAAFTDAVQNEMYVAFCGDKKGMIGKFVFDSSDMEIYDVDGVDAYFSCIREYGDNLYLVTRPGEIICWDKKEKKVNFNYPLKMNFDQTKLEHFSGGIIRESLIYGEYFYLFLFESPQYIKFDLNTHTMEINTFQQIKEGIKKIYISDSSVYILTTKTGIFYEYRNGNIMTCPICRNKKILYGSYIEGQWNNTFYGVENAIFDMNGMLDLLDNMKNKKKGLSNETIGNKIYRFMKESNEIVEGEEQ